MGKTKARSNTRLLLIGPLPRTRPEGVSIAFASLVRGLDPASTVVVNSNWLSDVKNPGRFNLIRALESIGVVIRSLTILPRVQRVYLTVSTSRFGFIRDALLILLASIFGRFVICHLHGGGMRHFYLASGRPQRALLRTVYSRVDRIIVLGERLKGQFRFLTKAARNLYVVPNGLPPDMDPGPIIESRQTDQPIRMLYLSNLTPTKGIMDLIRALALLRKYRDARLVVCGAYLADVDSGSALTGAEFRDQLIELVDELKLRHVVSFRGVVTGAEKRQTLRDCHIFVLPTYYRWEGQPISIIEAQAWGLPVVTTDHRAIADTVRFGKSAELCKRKDPNSIVAAISKIITSQETYETYAAEARQTYLGGFRNADHIEKMRIALNPAAQPPHTQSKTSQET